jgi:hypothetical protein
MTSHGEDALKVLGRVSAGRAGGSDRPPGSQSVGQRGDGEWREYGEGALQKALRTSCPRRGKFSGVMRGGFGGKMEKGLP